MQAHPGGGEKESSASTKEEQHRDSHALVCVCKLFSDSLNCHHIVEIFICEEGNVVLITYVCAF